MPAEWEIIRDECRARRCDAIPTDSLLPEALVQNLSRDRSNVVGTSGHFTDAEIAIINTPARKIVAKIQDRTWSAVEVTRAFCKSAAVAQQLVSFQIRIADALRITLITRDLTDKLLNRGLFRRGYTPRHVSRRLSKDL